MRASALPLALLLAVACSREEPRPAPPSVPAAGSPPPAAPAEKPARVEEQALASLRAQPYAAGTLADLALPEPYLRRVADRVIRENYWEQMRVIVADGAEKPPDAGATPPRREGRTAPVRVHRRTVPAEVLAARSEYAEGPPERPGFRVRACSGAQPEPQPSTRVDPALVPKDFVLKRLARNGLLATTAAVIAELRAHSKSVDLAVLEACGLPVDWLACFAPPDEPAASAEELVGWIEGLLSTRRDPDALAPELARALFAFRPSAPGFRVASESGEETLELLRLQLTRGDHWAGEGDGGSVDLVRQLVEALPDVALVAGLSESELPKLLLTAGSWRWSPQSRFDLLVEPAPLAQWAQDNAKVGTDAKGRVTLVPRFATRGELGSSFVPGESFALEALPALGERVVSSPLVFQGGNLYCFTHPVTHERTLLVGEAELHRNCALGLTPEQVRAALRAEFGVDRCVVLPALGFHVDVEVSVRALESELVAFVNDQVTAAQLIVRCGLEALQRHGELAAGEGARIEQFFAARKLDEALAILTPVLQRGSPGPGQFSESVARAFSLDASDNGPGNLQRFLAALDLLTGVSGAGDQASLDPDTAAYLRSFLRREKERVVFIRGLESAGLRIVPLPASPEDMLGIVPLNGIHDRTRYLFPTYGGIYQRLDEECRAILSRTLGPSVAIVPVRCAETQRRGGALHCAAAAYPRVAR